jgi:dUTP pyrophosphatase
MKIKIVNRSKNPLPAYETIASAGMDLKADLEENLLIKPMQRVLISTGLFIEIPVGFEAQVRPRSGLAYKKGVGVVNSPGTIDADYRGEIKVIVINLSNEDLIISNGERIAQMVVSKHERIDWEEAEELSQTDRGAGGFGSTGKK